MNGMTIRESSVKKCTVRDYKSDDFINLTQSHVLEGTARKRDPDEGERETGAGVVKGTSNTASGSTRLSRRFYKVFLLV